MVTVKHTGDSTIEASRTQAIRAVHISGFDLMVLMETNIINQAYFWNKLGYNILCLWVITTSSGSAQGGVGLFVWDQPQFRSIESMCWHGPNVVSWEVVAGIKRLPIIGTYLPTSILEHLPYLEDAMTCFRYQDHIVLENLKANIVQSQNP